MILALRQLFPPMPHIKPPTPLPTLPCRSVFLAGSIEMGHCANWQQDMADEIKAIDASIVVLNPRREEWDASWEQDISNPQFLEQVQWELDAIAAATVVAFYLDPATRAPISLLELGLVAASRPTRALVCCPQGYWRRGNVQVICARHAIPMVPSLAHLPHACLAKINEVC